MGEQKCSLCKIVLTSLILVEYQREKLMCIFSHIVNSPHVSSFHPRKISYLVLTHLRNFWLHYENGTDHAMNVTLFPLGKMSLRHSLWWRSYAATVLQKAKSRSAICYVIGLICLSIIFDLYWYIFCKD